MGYAALRRVIATTAAVILCVQVPAGALAAERSAGPTLLFGRALDSAGAAAADGDVYLFDVTTDSRSRTPVAHAKASSDGSFRLGLEPTKAIASAAPSNGGWNNFMAYARKGDWFDLHYFSRRWDGTAWVAGAAEATAGTSVTIRTMHVALARKPAPGTLDADLAQDAAASAAGPGFACEVVATHHNVPTTVARIETARNSRVTFTYGQQADSDVDVAVQVVGQEAGGWSIQGSRHVGNSSGFSVPYALDPGVYRPAAAYIQIGINYEDKKCLLGDPPYVEYVERSAKEWTGGLWPVSTSWYSCSSPVNVPTCSNYGVCYGRGSSGIRKWQGTNRRYSAAAAVAGVTLGATSGWSTDISMTYDFGVRPDPENPQVYWCLYGSNTWPAQAADVYMASVAG
jgi:hypothetical protein